MYLPSDNTLSVLIFYNYLNQNKQFIESHNFINQFRSITVSDRTPP